MAELSARQLRRLLAPIWRRLRLQVSRGVIRRSDDERKLQELQLDLLAGETAEMERFQQYGFSSRPLEGAEALAAAVGGSRSHLVAFAVDDRRHRPRDLQPGESIMYTDEGDFIRMRRGRVIEVVAGSKLDVTAPEVEIKASTKVTLDTPMTEISGDVQVGGQVAVQGNISSAAEISDADGSMGSMRQTYNGHTHTDSEGGNTSQPAQQM